MPSSRTLSRKDGETIAVDQRLTYKSGKDESYCEANVTVTEVGMAGCWVRIDEILWQGNKSTIQIGSSISAGWSELEITIP